MFGQIERKEILAIKINESIEIDGYLNEPGWKRAPDASDLMQFKPERGKRDPLNTIVKILYDNNFIYFGFYCYDPQPNKIKARIRERDKDLRFDDSVYVLMEALFDTDYFYYFGTNLIGAQLDGKLSLDGQRADVKWNGIWKAASQKTDFGWSSEIAIDLNSLEFELNEDKTIGLILSRIVARTPRSIFREGPLDPAFKISYLGQIKRIELLKAVKRIRISPHVFAASEEGDISWFEWGIDVPVAFSQMVSGRLTINPDFVTVEADKERINLTRFELYLPEKRDFFLEGSEIYDQPIRLFYSKRIPDIYGGANIYGKSGGLEFSGMSVYAREEGYTGDEPASFSVLRLKQNVMKFSSIGFLAANKIINGKNIGTAGINTSFHFTDTISVTGQFAASYGDHSRENLAFFLRPSYDSATFHFHLGYYHLGENFGDNVNKVGFIQDDNRRELDSGIGIAFFRNKGFLDQIKYNSNYNIYWGMDNALRSWQVDQELTFDLRNKFSFIAHHTQEFKAQEDFLFEEDFRNHITKFGIGFNTKEWEYAILSFSFGRNFGDTFDMLGIRKNLRVTRDLNVEFDMARIFFYGISPRNQFVHMLKARYNFSKDFYAKILYQTNTLIKKSNIELLLTYRLLPPFGYIQLVYQIGRGKFGERETFGNTFFLKLSYTF